MLIKRYYLILRHSPALSSASSCIPSLHLQRRCSGVVVLNIPRQTNIIRQYPSTSVLGYVRYIGSRNARVDKDSLKKKVDLPYPEQKVKVYTCGDLYERWKTEKKFSRTPKSGVFTEISYVDTMINKGGENKDMLNAPTVLCIHGIPGNYGVFSHLITDLGSEGIRIIVPTFPDTLDLPGKYGTELFRHSVEEKTEVFKSFLKALNVTQLDGIVAHSSAIYPALRLALDPELKVKCQVFFNTGGHKKTVTMRPYWVLWLWAHMYLQPLGRKFAITSGKIMVKYFLRTPIKDDDMHGVILLATTMVFSEYRKTKEQFQEVARRQMPTLLCFSEDDKVVERNLTYEVISLLGASKENISYYDAEGNLKVKGVSSEFVCGGARPRNEYVVSGLSTSGPRLHYNPAIHQRNQKSWLKLLSFQAGSHYVFRKHPKICNKEVMALLQSVKDKDDKE